jgi:predicted permease
MSDLLLRLKALFLRNRVERDLDDEVEFHVEMQTRKNVAAGMPQSEARRLARIEFGGETRIKEQCRDERRISFFETLFQDTRYALRGFRKTPLFALTVIATIALGLGINTAVFTIFNAYVLRPIAVVDPHSLYQLIGRSNAGGLEFTMRQYDQFHAQHNAFSEMFAIHSLQLRVNGRNSYCQLVSGNYFSTLGVLASLGRTLLPSDTLSSGREPVVVLSHGAWQTMFAGDPEVVGKKVYLRGYPFEIVGVTPDGFGGMAEMPQDFWAPISMLATVDPSDHGVGFIGRLNHELSVQQAEAILTVTGNRLTTDQPDDRKMTRAILRPRATSVPLSRDVVLVMSPVIVAFAMVLLIACANVANMMLARAMARQREIGIRLSLGAARARLIRQLLTESVLLALPAAAVGFAISQVAIEGGLRVMFATLPSDFAEYLRIVPLPPDYRVFVFMMFAAVAAAVLFGLVPALQATRASVIQAARGDFGNQHRPSRLRNALVIVQITGSVLLLICTGVLLRGANRIHAVDNGMETNHVVEMEIQEKARARVLAGLASEPLVETVAASSAVPLDSAFPGALGVGGYDYVSPEFFSVFGIPILQGRTFTQNEALAGAPVGIITQAVASRLFPNENAIGKSIRLTKDPGRRQGTLRYQEVRVIGVARDINTELSDSETNRSYIFFPTTPAAPGNSLVIRVKGDSQAARQRIDAVLAAEVPGSVDEIHTMRMFVLGRQYPFKVAYWVSASVGMLALLLAIAGIYGVISYVVMQRRKEIGIRMVMGASEAQMVGLVLKQSVRLAVIGLSAGTILALVVSRIYSSAFDKSGTIDTFDPFAYSGAIALVFAACVCAALFPSRKAARIDPVTTLRCD